MDHLHNPDDRAYITDEIAVRDVARKWNDILKTTPSMDAVTSDNVFQAAALEEMFGIEKSIAEELPIVCGIDKLECEGELEEYKFNVRVYIDDPSGSNKQQHYTVERAEMPEGSELNTLRCQKEEQERRSKARMWNNLLCEKNMTGYQAQATSGCKPSIASHSDEGEASVSNFTTYRDVLLCVTFYKPYFAKNINRSQKLHIDQQMIVRGSQPLTALRDKVSCNTDIGIPGDFSVNPEIKKPVVRSHHLHKSGCLFINNVFYNDMRVDGNIEYSANIMQWANEKSRNMGPFKTAKMEDTAFVDLKLRLGYPYVYIHQGNCEHVFVFSDIRMMNPDDFQEIERYPLHQTSARKYRVLCMICKIYTAKWVTRGSKRVPIDPFFYCDNCYQSFNYDKDNEKIGDFVTHPFIDSSALLTL